MRGRNRTIAGASRAATIADVARLAGVSPMTVSRVVNGESNVSPATQDRVRSALSTLRYVPNQAARHLAGGQPIRIGVLYGNPSASYLGEFLVGLLSQATDGRVQLMVQKCEAGVDEAAIVRQLLAAGVDGLILPPPLCDSASIVDLVSAAGIPAVAVASGQPDERLNALGIDDRLAAQEMTRHLLALGHRRLGFIVGHPNQTASARRLQGFRDAMAAAGLGVDEGLVAQGRFSYRSGLAAAAQIFAQEKRPTAVFASNDDMAAATVAIAQLKGLEVPRDVSVVGFDDAPLAKTIWPALTTVRQPIQRMAEVAVELLVTQIRAGAAGKAQARVRRLLDFSLIQRQSDAAPGQLVVTML